MSKILKGFVEIESLQSITPGQISPLGELSVWCMTYTKDKAEFSDPAYPGLRLVSVSCRDSVAGLVEPLPSDVTEAVMAVQYAMAYTALNLMPYDPQNFQQTLAAKLYSNVTNLAIGPLLSNGHLALPEWISWNSIADPGTTVKIWLSDTAFAQQFDEFEITVVPPLPTVDDFFKTPTQVKAEIAAITPSQMMDTIQTAKARNPETYIRTETFNYQSPVLGTQPLPTNWNVLIYGMHGDNIDSIKLAIQNYILSNTTHTQSDWEQIFPDIFKNTEFVILPRWDEIAIPDLSVQSGLYSSVSTPDAVTTFCQNNISFYDPAWIASNIAIVPFTYKTLVLDIVTGPTNADSAKNFKTVFPDYLPLPTTSLDFNRMTVHTQNWILLMEQMLLVAENFDSYLTIPDPIRVIARHGVTYLSAFYNDVEYLVALKGSYK